jgi:PPP family 3-phenylpropionic acid transporter
VFGPLSRFLALYAALFSAFGVASPFLPALLASKGLNPSDIGIVLAAPQSVC